MDDQQDHPKAACRSESAEIDVAITEAMIQAGIEEFWKHDIEDGSRVIVKAVFLAMLRARYAKR